MTKTAYVTGSTGFLGLNIVQALQDDGWNVIALRRKTSNTRDLDNFNITQVEGDVLDIESMRRTMPENVDAVFHVAADTGTWARLNDRQNKINIQGTKNVVDVALEKKAGRLIHTSSLGAFGNIFDRVIDESTPSRAMESKLNYYRSKYLAELEVFKALQNGLDAVLINPSQIIGAYDYHYTPQIFDSIKRRLMFGYPVGNSVLGHARDYAKAHVSAYYNGKTGDRYLLGGVHASFKELFDSIGALLNVKTPNYPLPPLLINATAFVMEKIGDFTNKEPMLTPEKAVLLNNVVRVDCSKAERELGFSTCSLDEMVSDCYQWMRRAGVM